MHPLLSLYAGVAQLLSYLFDAVGNYGVAIVILTVIVRLAMIPLAVKQAHMMQKARPQQERMKKIQPELKKIRDKYREDRQKQFEETQRLMKENDINQFATLSGCLPMLLQMPVFLAMYRVLSGCGGKVVKGVCSPNLTGIKFLPKGTALRAAIMGAAPATMFLGMRMQLSPSQAVETAGVLGAIPYFLLIGAMGLTMWYQTKQTTRLQPPTDPQQAAMMKPMQYMWILFVFFSYRFPSGLIVYWVATNVWTIGQQYILLKRYGPQAEVAQAPSKAGPSAPGSKTGRFGFRSSAVSANGAEVEAAPVEPNGGKPAQGKPKGSGAKKKRKKKGRK